MVQNRGACSTNLSVTQSIWHKLLIRATVKSARNETQIILQVMSTQYRFRHCSTMEALLFLLPKHQLTTAGQTDHNQSIRQQLRLAVAEMAAVATKSQLETHR